MNKKNNTKFDSKKHIPVYGDIVIWNKGSNNAIKSSIYWSQIPSVLDYHKNATHYKWLGKTYKSNELPVWSW